MTGTTGTGKTHLAAAITNEAINNGKEAIFGTWDDHTDRLKDDFGDPDGDYLDRLKDAELLVIDDLYDYDQSSWEQKTMFKIINSRTANGLATVITTNLSPAQIESAFGQRIASRLKGSCRISMLKGKDYRAYRG
jgi:DNA replication protein DnaC